MARPAKTLAALVRDGAFRARRHAHLLGGDRLPGDDFADFAALQDQWREADRLRERQAIARDFQALVLEQQTPERRKRGGPVRDFSELQRELRKLGPSGSARRRIGFFPRFLTLEDGRPFVLDDWQQDFIRRASRRFGGEIFREILLGIPRGNGKTPLASGLSLEALCSAEHGGKVFQGAGARRQAAIGTAFANRWVGDDAALAPWFRGSRSRVERRDGVEGFFEILSSQGNLAHGEKLKRATADEWWLFLTAPHEQLYTAFESALHKDPDYQLLAISTAGWKLDSQLGRAYTSGLQLAKVTTHRQGFLTIGEDREAGRLMVWYGMPDGYELDLENDAAVLRALRFANPGSWVNHRELLRGLKRALQKGEELEWLRLALNAWTKAKGAWLSAGVWGRCYGADAQIPAGADIYVMVDAAHSYDSTAVGWAWRTPSGRVLVKSHVFSVRDDAPAHEYVAHFYDEEAEEHVAEPFIHELGRHHRIREIVFDPNYFGTEGQRLSKRFRTAPLYPQSKEMREYVQGFYRGVHERLIEHDGDPVLASHIAAIAGRKTEDGYWKIAKLDSEDPIDAGVSVIGAAGRAMREPAPSDPWVIVR